MCAIIVYWLRRKSDLIVLYLALRALSFFGLLTVLSLHENKLNTWGLVFPQIVVIGCGYLDPTVPIKQPTRANVA